MLGLDWNAESALMKKGAGSSPLMIAADELQVLDVTSCQVAQRACQLGLLRDQLTPLGYPRLVLVLDLEVGAEHLEELIEGR